MITVVGRALKRFTVTCTDEECLSILEFDSSDIKSGKRYSMGRECGNYVGIVCPECKQILEHTLFTEIP